MKEVYLDNSATTRPLPKVVEYIQETLTNNYGNPSSLHNLGLRAERILKEARKVIADKLGVKSGEIYFTSGGTESNNLAIKGIAYQFRNRGNHLVTTEIEHSSVLDVFKTLEEEGFTVTYLKPDKQGIISLEDLKNAIRKETILVSIMHINNELGSIQPVQAAGKLIKEINGKTFFHVDGIQSFGKILVKPGAWKIDLFSISAHKIHGPKGIGGLYVKKGIDIKPLVHGGGQEAGLRSGTENVPGIAGFIPAVKALPEFTSSRQRAEKMDRLKHHCLHKLKEKLPEARVNSPESETGAPHIVNLSLAGTRGEILVHSLEKEGIYISTGSACHSRTSQKSGVLEAIQLSPALTDGTIRISFSRYNSEEEIDYMVEKLAEQVELYF